MEAVKSFSDWWKENLKEYEKIGINYIVAKSIWDAACDTFQSVLLAEINTKP